MSLFKRERELRVGNARHLVEVLGAHRINISSWGQSATKTPDDLLGEIEAGETVLAESKGKILRKVSVVGIDVLYQDVSRRLRLVEKKQVFRDGAVRHRTMKSSVSEKLKVGENPKSAAERGIREELRIKGSFHLKDKGKDEDEKSSPSYPGLGSKYVTHYFETWLNGSQYEPEGYIEDDGKKQTFFVWKEV